MVSSLVAPLRKQGITTDVGCVQRHGGSDWCDLDDSPVTTRQGATGHAEALWEAKLQDFAGKLIYKEGRGLGGPAFRRHLKG